MILHSLKSALVLDKPAGMSTHTPDSGATPGFLEIAEKTLDQKLWAVHRLDRDTSGCLIFALSAEVVAEWTEKLRVGKKKYIFISPQESPKTVWSFEGRIEKVGSHVFDLVLGEPNSQTTFVKIGKNFLGFIYEAEISTGKTHQIRIHAQKSGIPILGDTEHGGAPHPRLMLHSRELLIDDTKVSSPDPLGFFIQSPFEEKFLQLSKEVQRIAHKFLTSFDRRRFLTSFTGTDNVTNAYRLCHREWFPETPVSIEKLGEVLQVMSYAEKTKTHRILSVELLEFLSSIAGCSHWILRHMMNRGSLKFTADETDLNVQASEGTPIQWQIKENGLLFDLRHNQGMSAGLFLDQRDNRKIVRGSCHGKLVANFFSYTCGFSVAAVAGGAAEVVSIDTSKQSLEWGKDNFKLNKFDPDRFEFFTADTLFFLSACQKRGRKFDLIILDPPTFSRGKHGIFRLSENLTDLFRLSFACLAKEGRILFTYNDEELNPSLVAEMIEATGTAAGFPVLRIERIRPPLDFEFPLERNAVLRGFWIAV